MRWALDRSSVGAAVIANVDNHLFSKQSFFSFVPGARLGVPEHDDVVMTRVFYIYQVERGVRLRYQY